MQSTSSAVGNVLGHGVVQVGDAQYQTIVRNITEGIWQIDGEGITTFVNPSMGAMLGYSCDEMLGRHLFAFMDEVGITICKRNIELRKQGISEQHDFELLAKDGRRVYVIMETAPVYNSAGGYAGAIAGVVNITKRKEHTDMLAKSLTDLNFLREALDKHSLVSITDPQGIIRYANETFCRVSQYTLDELVGNPHSIVNSGYHPKEFFAELWRTIRRNAVWQGLICNRAKDGSYYWVNTTIVGSFGPDGKPVKYVSIRTDVSGCIRSEERLTRHVDELDRFAYAVAHDLKSPLQSIHKLAGWIAEETQSVETANLREYLRLMQLRLKRLDNHIDGLLRYAKHGHSAGEIRAFDAVELVQTVIERLGVGGTFRFHVDPSLPRLCGHAMRLDQVFANLIGNAIAHHSERTGTVWVGGIARDSFYEFYVRDDGPGIDPAYHQSIFEMFTTLSPRDRKESSGIGLGLVKRLVELEGGVVSIDSTPGDGTTIRFTWPMAVEAENDMIPNVNARASGI